MIEALERRQLMDGTIWVAPADNPEVHGTNATLSAPVGSYMDSSQAWTLSLSSIPAHTLVTQSGFNVAVFEQQDDGCGGSCCGGSCGGSCGGGCGGSSGNDTFSFTLSLNGQTVGQLSFDQSDASWTGSDDAGDPGWGGGFNPDSMPITDGGDSEAWSITPNIPADDGYRHYVWTVSTGAVSAGTDVWVNNVQDAYRQTPPQPGIVQFSRDIAIAQDQTVYYAIGGTAVHGVLNGDGTYTPANADYTGGTPVPGYNDLYSVTIPAGSASAQVQFTPIVPYINPLEDPEKSINIMLSVDLNPPENVIAADAPGGATKPAGTTGIQHGLNDIRAQHLQGELTSAQIAALVNQFADDNLASGAEHTLVGELDQAPSGSCYNTLLDMLDDWEITGPQSVVDRINETLGKVWGYSNLSFDSDAGGRVTIAIPLPPVHDGAATVSFTIDQAGNAIKYHFAGPLWTVGGIPVGTAPPPIFFNVNNPGDSALTITVNYYDSNGNLLRDSNFAPIQEFVRVAYTVVRT